MLPLTQDRLPVKVFEVSGNEGFGGRWLQLMSDRSVQDLRVSEEP